MKLHFGDTMYYLRRSHCRFSWSSMNRDGSSIDTARSAWRLLHHCIKQLEREAGFYRCNLRFISFQFHIPFCGSLGIHSFKISQSRVSFLLLNPTKEVFIPRHCIDSLLTTEQLVPSFLSVTRLDGYWTVTAQFNRCPIDDWEDMASVDITDSGNLP